MGTTTQHPSLQVKTAKLRDLRAAKGWTIRQAAQIALISKTHWGDVETNRRHPSLKMLGQMAEALGVQVEELTHGGKSNAS